MSQHSNPESDRNLLFGILAVQMNFISRDDLIAGMNSWVLEKSKPLGKVLLQQGRLSAEQLQALETVIAQHLKAHGNDVDRSLQGAASESTVASHLTPIADDDVQASLSKAFAPREPETVSRQPSPDGVRYRRLRPHATGGLGEVFVAEDTELHREVALKEIRPKFADDPECRGRFMKEAEITGGLEHPGIVPVYGLGVDAVGRPHYAMRFIRGESLKDAIARFHAADKPGRDGGERRLAFRQLLRRFVDVCNAVAYAHSRGVVHRDLKPANIMLGKFGETLVVDWGLAKAGLEPKSLPHDATVDPVLRPSSGSDAYATQFGSAFGTAAYMAPEQAAGRLDLLGPASDIYSLGSTLYVLLTGKRAYEGKDDGEILAKVRRGEFPPPREVKPVTPPALDAICRNAMALRPADRYATALDFAADVEHWLADEPAAAYSEPWNVRMGRWARRHRTVVVAAGVFLVSAVVALSLTTAMVWQEQRKTAAQKRVAELNYEMSRDLSFSMVRLIQDSETEIAFSPELHRARKDILKLTSAAFGKHLEAEPNQLQLRERAAQIYRYTGNVHRQESEMEAAEAYFTKSIRLYEGLVEQYSDEIFYQEALADTLRDYSKLQADFGRLREATATLRQAVAIAEKLLAADPKRSVFRRNLARTLLNLSNIELTRGSDEVGKTAAEAVKLFGNLASLPPDERRPYDPVLLAASLNILAVVERESGLKKSYSRARDKHKDAINEIKPLVGKQLAGLNANDVLHFRSWFLLEQSRTLIKGPAPPPALDASTIALFALPEGPLLALCKLSTTAATLKVAEFNLGAVIEQWKRQSDLYPQNPRFRESKGVAHQVLGQLRLDGRRYKEARVDLEESRKLLEAIVLISPKLPSSRGELGKTYYLLARLARLTGDNAGAAKRLDEAAKTIRQTLDQSPDDAQAQRTLKEVQAESVR
jgi:eukaryotic-like serine/threonine-protein kinase